MVKLMMFIMIDNYDKEKHHDDGRHNDDEDNNDDLNHYWLSSLSQLFAIWQSTLLRWLIADYCYQPVITNLDIDNSRHCRYSLQDSGLFSILGKTGD